MIIIAGCYFVEVYWETKGEKGMKLVLDVIPEKLCFRVVRHVPQPCTCVR